MKLFRLLAAALFVSTLAVSSLTAGDQAAADKPKDEACCECPKDKDGKACGVDKDCCCSGKKAEKKPEASADQKKS